MTSRAAAVVPPMVLDDAPPLITTPLPPPPRWPLPRSVPELSTTSAPVASDPMIVPLTTSFVVPVPERMMPL